MSENKPDLEPTAQSELDRLQTRTSELVTHALVLWVIRWTLGCALIWAITSWTGRFDWLWTAGIVVAFISLVVTISFKVFFVRKIGETVARLQTLDTAIDKARGHEEDLQR